ncbi:MAG TPA: hypothetical protein VMF06_10645 [Candidatus Limnocylindria bacterium]|jgi:hypothetical protein|nr:hypothetical protein [Candidatus Limnocylindria bacterium]
MTSDGISLTHWQQVLGFAENVARVASTDDTVGMLRETAALLRYLDTLESLCGRRPSILATRADYLDEASERIVLLVEAFAIASTTEDFENCTSIASSLAQIYIDDLGDKNGGDKWIGILHDCLVRNWDDFEHGEYQRLDSKLADL